MKGSNDVWRVANFKSLTEVSVELAPLTVIAGANSSGKSSLIQSLLMLGQSYGSDESVVLNGPVVRLGLGADVIRSGHQTCQLSLQSRLRLSGGRPDTFLTAEVSISLGVDSGTGGLHPVSVEVRDLESGTVLLDASTARINSADADAILLQAGSQVQLLKMASLGGRRATSRSYVGMLGVYPWFVAFHQSKEQIRRGYQQRFRREAVRNIGRLKSEFQEELSALLVVDSLGDEVAQLRDDIGHGKWERLTRQSILASELDSLSRVHFDRVVELMALARGSETWVYFPLSPYGVTGFDGGRRIDPLLFSIGGKRIQELRPVSDATNKLLELASEVRYVGPLRDEPKVLNSSWDLRNLALPVGIKGELTAEVLTTHRHSVVTYSDWNGRRHEDELPVAVSRWAEYLGIGERVSVIDRGKLGRQVTLTIDGVDRDLTTIGVGASQLLPVVVAALNVDEGSLLLVEQPELHLHPAVQSRLADFLAFARPDIRLIVETHSEYLVTRLRRRVAEEKLPRERVQVVFVEQDRGDTFMRTLRMNEFGDFDTWPKGFFDSQDEDSREIIAAVAARLRAPEN